jgi:hypothetical protein
MVLARTLACALAFAVLPLLAGCGRSPERVEDREPESIRKERRLRHEKLAPKGGPKGAGPTSAGAEKK